MLYSLSEIIERTKKSIKKEKERTNKFKSARAKCKKCGHEWNAIFFNVPNGETKLKCPKCGKRDSEIVR